MWYPSYGTYVGNAKIFGIVPEFLLCVVFPAEDVSPEHSCIRDNSLENICQLYAFNYFTKLTRKHFDTDFSLLIHSGHTLSVAF